MEAKIVKREKNPLFSREEIVLEIAHSKEATPSRKKILEVCATLSGNKTELGVVISVLTGFGADVSKALVRFYEKAEDLKKFEPEYIRKRNGMEVAEKKTEGVAAPAVQPAQLAPTQPSGGGQASTQKS